MSLEQEMLDRITPDEAEQARVQAVARRLEAAAATALKKHSMHGSPTVQGSVAKGTWLAGSGDMDCFLLMDPDLDQGALKQVAETIGPEILTDCRRKYAQHPYLVGTFEDFTVDLVPAYRVEDATQRMSAVDRTPFHTAWVREHLDEAARAQVRLLKRWCHGVGSYGAETAVGGYSGYLLEVLIHHFDGFRGVLEWFADAHRPRRLAPAGVDEVDDDVNPVVVVDPVDPSRNCAAAVQTEVMAHTTQAAQDYLDVPTERFFFPPPPRSEPAPRLRRALETEEAVWLAVAMLPRTQRLDIVLPQFQKAGRSVAEALDRAGFRTLRHRVDTFDDMIGMQWIVAQQTLPATRRHQGPAAEREPNATRFRQKWHDHPDAASPVTTGRDGHLVIDVTVRERTPTAWLHSNLLRIGLGKHVHAALGRTPAVLSDPADAPDAWAPLVAEHILDRRPWRRP